MARIVVDIKNTIGIEQGNITGTGTDTNPARIHSVGFIPLEYVGSPPSSLTIAATTSTGKTLNISYVIYNSQSYTDMSYDPDAWLSNPLTADLSAKTNVNYIATYARNSDNSNIAPSDITAWTITYDNGIAFEIGDDGYPVPIDAPEPAEHAMQAPYPDSVLRIDPEYNNGYPYTALMPFIEHTPTPPPEPDAEEVTIVQYDIYCDNQLMHSSVVPAKEWKVIDPVLDLQDSAAGSLEFTLPNFNCMYGKCQMMMSTISVRRNGVEIWEGRPVSFKEDMWLNHPITCEGELAYLNDIYQPQNKYENVTLQQLIYAIIGVTDGQIDTTKGYNQRAAANRRFNVSYIEPDTKYESDLLTVTVPFQTTLETINNICKTYGLHVYMDNVWNDGVKERRIKFVNDNGLGENVTQTIEFGRNLTDYAKSYNFSSLVTYVLPLGAKSNKAGATVKDNDETVNVKAAGLEQGTITSQGDSTDQSSKHSRRVRSSVYLNRPSGSDTITVEATPTTDVHGPLSYSLVFYNSNKGWLSETGWIASGTPTDSIGSATSAAYYRVVLAYTNDTDNNPINIVPSDVATCVGTISKTRKGVPYGTGDNGRRFVIWPNNKKDSAGNTHDAGDIVYLSDDINDFGSSESEKKRYFVNEYVITEENATVFITTQMKNGAGVVVVHANGQHYYIKKSGTNGMTVWSDLKFNGWYDKYSGTVKMYVAGYDSLSDSGVTNGQTVINSKVVDEGLEEYVTVEGIGSETDPNPNIDGRYVHDTDSSFYDNHVLPTDIYGRIEKKIDWPDAKDAWTLYNNAINYLRSDQFDGLEIQLTALDMAMLGFKATQLRCGEMVMCKCAPYGLYKVMPVTAIKIPLTKPEDTKYTVGSKNKQNLTSVNTSTNSELLSLIAEKPSMSAVMTAAKSSAAEYIMDTQNGYVTMRYGESGKPEAIIISDTEDYRSSPTGYWLIGKNGLGFIIPNGGPEEQQAITNCALKSTGEIVADRILTGTMIADRILGGTLKIGHWLNQQGEYENGDIQVKDSNGNVICQLNQNGVIVYNNSSWVNMADGKITFGDEYDQTGAPINGIFIKGNGSIDGHGGDDVIEIYGGTGNEPASNTYLGIAVYGIIVWVNNLIIDNVAYTGYIPAESARIQSGNHRYVFDKGLLVGVESASSSLADGTFDTADGKRVTVSDGLITSIENIPSNNS